MKKTHTKTRKKFSVKMVREIQRQILLEPRRFAMPAFFQESVNAPCGTAACIGGWAIALKQSKGKITKRTLPALHNRYGETGVDVWCMAKRALGIPLDSLAGAVMRDEEWPHPYNSQYAEAERNNDTDLMAIIAVARLEHLINFGE